MIDSLGLLTYPAWAAVSFLACAMRLFSFWQVQRSRKLIVLAVTNLFMFLAFSLVSLALQNPDIAQDIRPYRISVWAIGLPFYAYSVYLEWKEALIAAKLRQGKL